MYLTISIMMRCMSATMICTRGIVQGVLKAIMAVRIFRINNLKVIVTDRVCGKVIATDRVSGRLLQLIVCGGLL
jgi:hypothetical protein